VRYKKAPILEAVLEFRWSPAIPLEELASTISLPVYEGFEKPKPRYQINATLDVDADELIQERERLGFEVQTRDGLERVFLEKQKFVFIQSAPYDRWEQFAPKALALLDPTIKKLDVETFERVGVRFLNRIDAPNTKPNGIKFSDYVKLEVKGPNHGEGNVREFQLRIVRPTKKEGLSYALVMAAVPSPLPEHSGIILDIDVFTNLSHTADRTELEATLDVMQAEKNAIFELCLTDRARDLFGGIEE